MNEAGKEVKGIEVEIVLEKRSGYPVAGPDALVDRIWRMLELELPMGFAVRNVKARDGAVVIEKKSVVG